LARSKTKFLTIALLMMMVLAISYPALAIAEPTEWEAQPLHRIKSSNATPNAIYGFNPTDVRAAYGLEGAGTGTIAIIDAYDNPRVAVDLATFSTQFGLPAANLEVHKMSSRIGTSTGWGLEIALDVQWAHAIAPAAKILLIEARSAYLSDLLAAVNYARNRVDVVSVSMSWGGSEFSTQTAYNSYFTSPYGATFYASSGDTGGVIIWPSSSANVVSVGGTTLTYSNGVAQETAWSGSGGGVSVYEPKPGYQSALTYSKRATPDVSYNADPSTGFAVYDSYGYSGWLVVGGTSAGAPQWAAINAIGKSATDDNFYAGYPQSYGTDFTDITSGQSGSYKAQIGYDLTTGIGSPIGTNFGASPSPDFAISASPNPITINAGSQGTATVTISAINGFNDQVNLTASAAGGLTATLNPTQVTGTGTSTLTITVPQGTPSDVYQVTVTGMSGSAIHSTTVGVQVTTADFSLSVKPTSLTIKQGSTGTATVTVNPINGYTGEIALTADSPSGMTFNFDSGSVAAGTSAQMTINVSADAARATYTITITGTDNAGLTHSTAIRVKVTRG
jgi:subtilase family serine protease